MPQVPVTPSSSWDPIFLPTDRADYANTGTLRWFVIPLANRTKWLYDRITDLVAGVTKIATASSVVTLKNYTALPWDVRVLAGYGVYLFIPGAGSGDTTLDNDPHWFRSTASVGRWQNVATFLMDPLGGVGLAPLVQADGRIAPRGPGSVVDIASVRVSDTTPASHNGPMPGVVAVSAISGDKVLVNARVKMTTSGNVYLHTSTDGGATWTTAIAESIARSFGPANTMATMGAVYVATAASNLRFRCDVAFDNIDGEGTAQTYGIEAMVIRP